MTKLRQVVTDSNVIKDQIHQNVIDAIKRKFPIESGNYIAEISNVQVKEKDVPYNKQKDYALVKGTINHGLTCTLTIKDRNTGKVIKRMDNYRLMNIPAYSPRHTMMVSGNEYAVPNQLRTKSGVYTRVRGNEEIESSFNLARGSNFRLTMNPETGIFNMSVGGSSIRMYPVLRILGASDSEIEQALGRELYVKNSNVSRAQYDRARNTLFDKLSRYRSGLGDQASAEEKEQAIRQYFSETEVDPETTEITLGRGYSRVDYSAMLDAARKILRIFNQEENSDERDNLEFQKIHSVEDIMGEVIDKNREVVNKVKMKLKNLPADAPKEELEKSIKSIFSPATFSKPINQFITTSTLSRLPQQINPVEMINMPSMVTRMGEGAIEDERAVPDETRAVNYSYMGAIDPIATPESSKVGIDNHMSHAAFKGDDNEIYKQVKNTKTGEIEFQKPIELYDKYVGLPREKYKAEPKPNEEVQAIHRSRLVKVPYKKLDYIIPDTDNLFTNTSSMVPFVNASQANRIVMADKHVQQAMPLKDPDNRLVKTPRSGKYMADSLDVKAPISGTVSKIDDSYIHIKGDGGETRKVEYLKNFPLASKTILDNKIEVTKGERVNQGQILARSNFTKDGDLALGKNLSVAYMPYEGLNHEDGIVINESAARKLTSEHSDRVTVNKDKNTVVDKGKYTQLYPTNFTQEQLDKLDSEGVAREGVTLEQGDPIVLVLEDNSQSRVNQVLGKLHKSLVQPYRDSTITHDSPRPAEVVDARSGRNIVSVLLKSENPVELGDKLTGSYGNKGVVTSILRDDETPQDEDGNPIDLIFTPAGVPSRINPSQIMETALGKVAKKTGRTYEVPNYSEENYVDFVKNELDKHGIKDKENLYDPKTGKTIPNVFSGVQHIFKSFKTTDSNFAARGVEGPHDQDDAPTGSGREGPKAIGGMEINALLGHNARNVLRESSSLRSQKNNEFWKAFQEGQVPNYPTEKKTFDRFINTLKQAGVNVKKQGDEFVAGPLTDNDVEKMSSGEITQGTRLRSKDLAPEKGGLFDDNITGGLEGKKWGHVELGEPVINPVFEDPARHLLDMTKNQLNQKFIEEGGDKLKDELNQIDVDAKISELEKELDKGELKGQNLDKAVKKLKYLRTLRDNDLKSGDAYMLKKFPVTPPAARPITVGKTGDLLENDSNYLYRDLILQNNAFKEAKDYDLDIEDNRKALYDRVKETTGVIAPQSPQLQSKNVKGALDFISGDTPKRGYFQRKAIYSKQNLSGRATIAPDTELDLDEIGLPEEMAWGMYKPFIISELSKQGFSKLKAREEVEERTERARNILQDEMEKRPIIANRAPTLHRHSMLGAKPKLTSGDTLKVNTLWEKATNADHDGDSYTVSVPVSEEAIEDTKNMFPSKQLFTDKKKDDLLMTPSHEPITGLYRATKNLGRRITGKPKEYNSMKDAWQDYYSGNLKLTDPVIIRS